MLGLHPLSQQRIQILTGVWVVHCLIAANHPFGHFLWQSILIATVTSFLGALIAARIWTVLLDRRLFWLNITVLPLSLDLLVQWFLFRMPLYLHGTNVLERSGLDLLGLYFVVLFAILWTPARYSLLVVAAGAICLGDPFIPLSMFFMSYHYKPWLGVQWVMISDRVQQFGLFMIYIGGGLFLLISVKEMFSALFAKKGGKEDGVILGGEVSEDEIVLPQKWDELQIGREIRSYGENKNILLFYVQQVIARFVDGQEKITADSRIAFLEKQNELIKVALENYKLRREVGRAPIKENAADIKARTAVAAAGRDEGLDELRYQSEAEKLHTQIAEERKKREILNRPEPVLPPEPKREDPAELRKRRQKEIPEELAALEKRMQAIRDDPAKKEADKRREINMYEDKKEKLYEELSKYL